jgi:hypothetical protein
LDGELVARVEVGKSSAWNVLSARLLKVPAGVHDLVVSQPAEGKVEVDWMSFD